MQCHEQWVSARREQGTRNKSRAGVGDKGRLSTWTGTGTGTVTKNFDEGKQVTEKRNVCGEEQDKVE